MKTKLVPTKELDDIHVEQDVRYTIHEIAKLFGVRPKIIRQIEAQALRKLRQPSRSKYLAAFVDYCDQSPPIVGGGVPGKKSLEQLEEWVPKYWPKVI